MSDEKKDREYVYRCRLCGELKANIIGCFTKMDALCVFIELDRLKDGENAVYCTGANIPRTSFHDCKDGGFGISDLVGVRDHV